MSGSGAQFSRNVFVLDVSGSMGGNKCQTLQLGVTRIIEQLPDNSYVGVVLFENYSLVQLNMTQITDRAARDRVIQSIPAMANGGTNIGSGILSGAQLLSGSGLSTEGSTMFLATDGGDTTGTDYVSHVMPTLLNYKIKVVCLAIGNEADVNLERLARETKGNTYATNNSQSKEMIARVIESTIQEIKVGKELAEVIFVSVCDDIIELNQSIIMKTVVIDPDIGRNTTFTIGSEDYERMSVIIQSPNGNRFDMSSPEMTRNSALKRYELKVSKAETGIWTITLNKTGTQKISANLSVKSQALGGTAVELRTTLIESDSTTPPIIVAKLHRGNDFVIGAQVSATIDRPNGTQTKLQLKNYDNIYANYFTDYCGCGRYNVTVMADTSAQCRLKNSGNIAKFERQQVAGSFKVSDNMPSTPLSDQKLRDLSLSTQFSALTFRTNTTTIQAPAPRNARARVVPMKQSIPQSGDAVKIRKDLNHLLIVVKKALNSNRITDEERSEFKKTVQQMSDRSMTSSVEQMENDLNVLNGIKQKLI